MKRIYFEKQCIARLYLPKDQRQSFNDIKVIDRVVILVSQNPFSVVRLVSSEEGQI